MLFINVKHAVKMVNKRIIEFKELYYLKSKYKNW